MFKEGHTFDFVWFCLVSIPPSYTVVFSHCIVFCIWIQKPT